MWPVFSLLADKSGTPGFSNGTVWSIPLLSGPVRGCACHEAVMGG